MKSGITIFGIFVVTLIVSSCGGSREVTRVDPNTQIDLSGRWNDTDSKLVAEEMIGDVLSKPWLTRFETKYDRRPVVIIGDVVNRSHEHISSETFIKDIERACINSGKVRLVENASFRDKLREELESQQTYASEETRKQLAKELGADFIMFGTINSIVDELGKERVVAYKTNLELVNLQTTEKVWIGDKEIKKYIKN
jgi:uncharacterized protein (TIGR02722 family)